MFTGLVEARGTLTEMQRRDDVVLLCITAPGFVEELVFGQSVAVSGACLTVTRLEGTRFWVDVMAETMGTTIFGSLRKGRALNLERAMLLNGRFEGHIVSGHVDYLGTVRSVEDRGQTRKISIGVLPEAMRYLVPKGSVALDGVSLTVVECGEDFFSVGLIPTTLQHTTIGMLKEGMRVNVETDLLGKYVYHQMLFRDGDSADQKNGRTGTSLDWEFLGKTGWL